MPGYAAMLLKRDLQLAATAALCTFNGTTYSALFDPIAYFLYLFTRGTSFIGADVLFALTSVSLSLMTLLLAGVPAAAYERLRGLKQSTPLSLAIWLAAALLLTLPTLLRLFADE